MAKLRVEDLEKIKERVKAEANLGEESRRARVIVHMGTCGIASGAEKVLKALLRVAEEKGARDVIVTTSGCAGLCCREPMATVRLAGKPPVKYVDLTEEKIRKIFVDHVLGGEIVKEFALAMGSERTY